MIVREREIAQRIEEEHKARQDPQRAPSELQERTHDAIVIINKNIYI